MTQPTGAIPPPAGIDAPGASTSAREFLTFTLGTEKYALEILKVQEIRRYGAVTRIANTPPFIKGVINLRGIIVPIVDLRIKFSIGEERYDDFTVVIIANLAARVIGIVVDSVSDVISLAPEQIKPAPELGAWFDTRYLTGLGTVDEHMLILVDLEKLLTSEELALAGGPVQ